MKTRTRKDLVAFLTGIPVYLTCVGATLLTRYATDFYGGGVLVWRENWLSLAIAAFCGFVGMGVLDQLRGSDPGGRRKNIWFRILQASTLGVTIATVIGGRG